jgi:hypothetical protein
MAEGGNGEREIELEEVAAGRMEQAGTSRRQAESGPHARVGRFRLPAQWRALVERHRWVAVVGASFAVLLLLLTSLVPQSALIASSGVHTDSSPLPPSNDSSLTLAFANASLFPAPSTLPASAGNLTLPRLVMIPAAPEAVEGLLYVENDSSGHHLLQFQTGQYDPLLAQDILTGQGCPNACPPTIPLHWNAPTTIYDFGLETVIGDAIASDSGEVAVAASANNDTWVWLAAGNYAPGDWQPMNESHYRLPIQGGDPKLAISGCTIVLTTGAPGTLRVTTFQLACQSHPKSDEGGHYGPLLPPPSVTEVSPDCGPANHGVTIYGANFLNGAEAIFGGTGIPTQYVSSTQLTATAPSGTGTVDVQISQSSGESAPNPPADQWTWSTGAQPCVWSLSPTSSVPSRSVTINGYGFSPSASVKFGNAVASTRYVNTGQLTATVPLGCGIVPVTVLSQGYVSPVWAGSMFTITATYPTVTSLYPYSGGSGTQVTVNGTAFDCATPSVKFGSNAGTGVTVLSYSKLKVTAPSGTGTVDVTVTESGHTSNTSSADQFSYTPGAIPTVSGLNVTSGTVGTAVTITGTNYDKYATVKFGSVSATSVHYVSATTLTCVAPLTYGKVNVTVTVNHLTSATNGADLFTYPNPVIGEVYPDYGSAGDVVLISGSNLAPDSTVLFGTVRATSVTHLSTQAIDATVPAGSGTVPVIVVQNGTNNTPSLMSRFSYQRYAPFSGHFVNFTAANVTLGTVGDAQPVLWRDPNSGTLCEGVLASNSTSGTIVYYSENNTTGVWFTPHSVTGFGASTGSAIFTSVGGTRLLVSGGDPGQVTLAQEGSDIFAAFTSRVDDRVAIQTAISGDGGLTWNVTYTATATAGVIEDPQLTASPAGPYFATWRDDGTGGWEVDIAVFSDSGHLTVASNAVVGSGGTFQNATSPTIAVDDWERPVVAWGSSGGVGTRPQIRFTGGFVAPVTIAQWIDTGFHGLTPSDFYPVLNLTAWRAGQNSSVDQLLSLLQTAQWCNAETLLYGQVYPNITQSFVYPFLNATPALCPGAPPIHYWPTEVLPTVGPGSPGTVFSVEEEWLDEALGYGIVAPPTWMGAPGGPPIVQNPPPSGLQVNSPGYATDRSDDVLSVSPLTVNPNTVLLNATGVFNSPFTTSNSSCGGGAGTITSTVTDAPANFTIYAHETFTGSLFGGSASPESYKADSPVVTGVYLVNLTGQSWGTWTMSVAANYQATFTYEDGCLGNQTTKPVSIPNGMPTFVNLTTNGAWSTELGFIPRAPPLLVTNGQNVTTTEWNNSMLATANITTNLTTGGQATTVDHQSARGYKIAENVTLGNVTISPGATYSTTFQLRSTNGGTDYANWTPRLNAFQNGYGFLNVSTTATCSYNMSTNPVLLYWDKNNITNITNTSVDLTWYASGSGNGEVVYWESYGPAEEQSAFDQTGVNYHGYSDRYTVELHDLVPWGSYTVEILQKKQDGGCHVFQNGAVWHFNTTRTFYVSEEDLPYDSITKVGGGAAVSWVVPLALLNQPGVSFSSGWVSLANASDASQATLYGLVSQAYEPAPGTFEENLSTLIPNTTYVVHMGLNYSYGGTMLRGTGRPYSFVYQKDSSGDGLTDWEKSRGWEVTTLEANGSYQNRWVTANPFNWATNGLVDDYTEKQFGLNPRTVDSAGSHMLDTWNLTFDLGSNSSNPSIPSGANFETWSELGHYDWTQSCPYFGASKCSGFVIGTDWSNLSDSAPWASEVLWSRSALTKFINMSGVQNASWLRAMLGTSGTERTLTVWGKLSWGANPLAVSTPNDGIPDGARVNPLGTTDLQVSVTAWSTSWSDSQHSLQKGNGVAAFIHSTSSSAPYFENGQTDYGNYTNQTNVTSGSSTSYGGTFTVTFPVVPTEQYANLNLSLIANVGVNGNNLTVVALNTPSESVDLLRGSMVSPPTFQNGTANSLSVEWKVVTVMSKAPTYLFVPSGNSTLSPLPAGLMRYVGDQDFVLLELNDTLKSTNLTATGIPFPGNSTGTYSATLQPGVTNVIVPRASFISSPVGQALMNGTNVTVSQTSRNSALASEFAPQEWYARATGSNWGTYNYSRGHSGFVQIFSSTTQTCSPSSGECGAVPSNPNVMASNNGLAIGAVFAINLNASTDFEGLLGGLLLNSSGNFTGWAMGATALLPSLGLMPSVLSVLANAAFENDGAFGPPTSSAVQVAPHPWWDVLATVIWNAVSGVITGALSIVWNAVVAVASYIGDLASNVYKWGLTVLNQAAKNLEKVASAIEAAINQFVVWVETQATNFMTSAWSTIKSALNSLTSWYALPIADAICGCINGSLNQIGPANSAVGNATLGDPTSLGDPIAAILSYLNPIGIGVAVVLGILSIITLGTSTIIMFIVSFLISFLFSFLSSQGVIPKNIPGFTGTFGLPWWSAAVNAGGIAANATLAAAQKSLGTSQQIWFDTSLAAYQSSTEFGAAMAFFGLALALAGKTPGGLLSAGFAVAFMALAIIGAMMILYVYVTSIVNYQAGHAVAVGMAALSMGMALFGGIGAFFILAKAAAADALNSNLLLLAGVGGLFVLFDIAAGVAIITS